MSTPLEVIQEGQKTLNGEFARWQGDIVWHNANILALLQALHDELEEREMVVEVALANPDAMAALRGYNDSIQDQKDNLQALIKKI